MFGVTVRTKKLRLTDEELDRCTRDCRRVSSKRRAHYTTEGGYPVVVETRYKSTTTGDTSSGWSEPHTGTYPVHEERRTYTPDGRLLQSQSIDMNPHIGHGGAMMPGPVYQFSPESRLPFVGRQIKR